MDKSLNPSTEELLLAWFNLVGEVGSLKSVDRLDDLWKNHIALFLGLFAASTGKPGSESEVPPPECALSCYEQAIAYLKTNIDNQAFISSVNILEASKGNKFEIAKLLVLLSYEMTVACANYMNQLIEHIETKVTTEITTAVKELVVQIAGMARALSNEETDAEEYWTNMLLVKDEALFDTETPDFENEESFNFAVPALNINKTPVKASDRRQTVSGAASLRKKKDASLDTTGQSIYCTPTAHRLQSRKTPGSPTAQLIDLVSSPLMKEKRAARALAEETKKVHDLEDQLQVAQAIEAKLKEAIEAASNRLIEEKEKNAEAKQQLHVATETLTDRELTISALEKKIRELERSNDGKKVLIQKNNQVVLDLERQKQQAEQVADELTTQVQLLKAKFKDASDENRNQSEVVYELGQKCDNLKRSLDRTIQEKEECIRDCEDSKASMRRQFMQKEEEFQFQMADQRNSTAAKIFSLENELKIAQCSQDSMESKNQMVESTRLQLKEERERSVLQIKKFEIELSDERKSMNILRIELKAAEEQLANATRVGVEERRKIRELEDDLSLVKDQNTKLLGQISVQQKDLDKLKADLKMLENTTYEMRPQLEKNVRELLEARKTIDNLSNELSEAKSKIYDEYLEHDKQRKANEEKVKELTEDHERVMKEQKFLSNQYIEDLKKKIDVMAKENAEFKKNEEELKAKISEYEAEAADVTIRRRLVFEDEDDRGQELLEHRASAGSSTTNLRSVPDIDLYDEEEPVQMVNKLLDGTSVEFTVEFSKDNRNNLLLQQQKDPKQSGQQLAALVEQYTDKRNAPQRQPDASFVSLAVPQTPEFGKIDSAVRLGELNARNRAMPPHLRSSYIVETAGFSPVYNEDDLRHSDRFEPIVNKKENVAAKPKDKRRSMLGRMTSFAKSSNKGSKTPLKEKN